MESAAQEKELAQFTHEVRWVSLGPARFNGGFLAVVGFLVGEG